MYERAGTAGKSPVVPVQFITYPGRAKLLVKEKQESGCQKAPSS